MVNKTFSRESAIAAGQRETERNYWFEQLSGDPEMSAFPYDRIDGETAELKTVTFELSDELCSRLLGLSKGSDPRLYMELAAGLTALLHRYTGKDDVFICAPIYKQEMEGEFINKTLILRNPIEEDDTFKTLLIRVRETIVRATEHQNYPIERLLRELGYSVAPGQSSLRDVGLALENIHDPDYVGDIPFGTLFRFNRAGEKITGCLDYDPSRFEESTAHRIARHYTRLLEQSMENLDIPVSDIDLLTEAEKKQVLVDFNDNTIAYPDGKPLHQLFEEQAARTPDHMAVTAPGGRENPLSYKELNENANQLAYFLRQQGVGKETLVALMLDRSVTMLTGILGILKSGGAYLPLNPGFPRERLGFMLEDSRAKILLTRGEYIEAVGEGYNAVAMEDTRIGNESKENPENINSAQDLAYVIYTSGSTGNPKGVMMEHSRVTNLIWGLNEKVYRRYEKTLNVSVVAPFEFDASVQQIFGALLLGHTLHIVPEDSRVNGEKLSRFYKNQNIHISDGTPTHIRILLEHMDNTEGEGADFPVKHFIIAGEVLPPGVVDRFFKHFEGELPGISNIYGPTETCVDSTSYEISPHTAADFDTIPIGPPLPNEQVYILDRHFQPQPIGAPGQLCIAGDGLARGYLNNPLLTAEKFTPFNGRGESCVRPAQDEEIIYLTGDLARWLPDGNLDFLGRIDQQLKIRGVRIEPGEIESRLLQHPDIKEAVVAAEESSRGYASLCAYLVLHRELNTAAIRAFLAGNLPDYMLPEHFVTLEHIPLTPSGKIDRKLLRQLGQPMDIGAEYTPPKTETQKTLAEIWKKELELEKAGIHDNFFDAGGDSLIILRINQAINARFNIRMKIEELYDNQTIETQAQSIDNTEDTGLADQYKEAAGELERFKQRMMKG